MAYLSKSDFLNPGSMKVFLIILGLDWIYSGFDWCWWSFFNGSSDDLFDWYAIKLIPGTSLFVTVFIVQ